MILRIFSNLIPCLLLWKAISIFCVISHARTVSDTNASGTPDLVYSVRPLVFSYGGDKEGLPELEELEKVFVDIGSSSIPLAALLSTQGDAVSLFAEDLFRLSEVALHFLKSEGYEGIVVFPEPAQIDPLTGKDLRPKTDTRLDLKVWVSRVESVELDYQVKDDIEESRRIKRIERLLGKRVEEDAIVSQPLRESFGRFVDRLGNHPGRSSRLLLLPGDEPGAVDAVVRLREGRSVEAGVHASNSGTETTGEWMLGGFARHNQITDHDDRLDLSWGVSNTGERKAVSLGYRRPLIGPDVLELGLGFSHSNYDASSFAVTRIDFEGRSNSASAELVWRPLEMEDEDLEVEFFAGVGVEESLASNSLLVGEGRGKFVSPRAGVVARSKGRLHQSVVSLAVSGNLSRISQANRVILGGIDVEDRFSRLSFSYLNRFNIGDWFTDLGYSVLTPNNPDNHHLHFRTAADIGLQDVRHLPQKQFILGGTGSVRGYPESPAAGDNGFLLSLEYRLALNGEISVGKGEKIKAAVAPFVDYGATHVNDPKDYEPDRRLLGAGIGLQFELPFGGSARVDVAKPLKKIVNSETVLDGTRSDDGRVHARVSWEF
jgi:hypothetical protein